MSSQESCTSLIKWNPSRTPSPHSPPGYEQPQILVEPTPEPPPRRGRFVHFIINPLALQHIRHPHLSRFPSASDGWRKQVSKNDMQEEPYLKTPMKRVASQVDRAPRKKSRKAQAEDVQDPLSPTRRLGQEKTAHGTVVDDEEQDDQRPMTRGGKESAPSPKAAHDLFSPCPDVLTDLSNSIDQDANKSYDDDLPIVSQAPSSPRKETEGPLSLGGVPPLPEKTPSKSQEQDPWTPSIYRAPGHQGSHSRSARSRTIGKEPFSSPTSALQNSVKETAARVEKTLKKPFRPPRPVARTSSPASSPPHSQAPPTSSPTSTATDTTFRSSRAAKPFIAPFSLPPSSGPRARSDQYEINRLEKENRIFKQAYKYKTEPEDEQRVVELIGIWKEAGREITEKLFDLLPKPEEGERDRPYQSFGYDFGGRREDDALTNAQREFLRNAPRNEDGDAVNEDGVPLIPEPPTEEEMGKFYKGEAGRPSYGATAYQPRSSASILSIMQPAQPPVTLDWNFGTMLDKFSIDHTLLGWDSESADWEYPDIV